MIPRLIKTANLAPVKPGRTTLHEMACAFAEEQFKLKGGMPAHWLLATGPHVAFIETDWQSNDDKDRASYAMRETLLAMGGQAYSFTTEAWTAAFLPEMGEAEQKHWMDFAAEHGVKNLPPHLRDDVLMVFSHDRDGGVSVSRYVVQMRKGKGPNYLGPRIDDEFDGSWTGRMGSLFDSREDREAAYAEAMREVAAARAKQ